MPGANKYSRRPEPASCVSMNARGHVNLAALLERLGALGIKSVMVEGGARIITSFLAERLRVTILS